MDYRRTLPFHYAYPQYPDWNQINQDMISEDMEYLQQMYPAYAKRYQVKINEILNHMDYEGSMIYDQYPDRWQLERLISSIMTAIRADEAADRQRDVQMQDNTTQQNFDDESKWMWIRELVTVLVYYEILRRRNKKKNYYIL